MEEIIFHQHVWPLELKSSDTKVNFTRDRILKSVTNLNKNGKNPSVLILWNQCNQQVNNHNN